MSTSTIKTKATETINNSVKVIEAGYKAQVRGIFTEKLHDLGGGIVQGLQDAVVKELDPTNKK